MKILLLGSPAFVLETFDEVRKNFEVVGVVTQPPRPQGRGLKLTPTPVAVWAKSHNLKLFEPEKIGQIYEELKALDFDLMLTFAFGQWVPPKVLALGKFKPLNIHGSLLPKYRGAAPVQHAVLNGDKEIGITLMEMVTEMDAGPMLFKAKKELPETMNATGATKLIADLARDNIVKWLKLVKKGEFKAELQGADFTLSPKFPPEFAELKHTDTAEFNLRKIRALSEVPGAYFYQDRVRVKVYDAVKNKNKKANFVFICANGEIDLKSYQFENQKRINF